jgi:hypothetical protein
VSLCIGLSGSGRECPALTGRSDVHNGHGLCRGGYPEPRSAEETAGLFRAWAAARPRTQQKTLGWSDMSDCRARLGYELRGTWPSDETDTWRAVVGTAMHELTTAIRRQAVDTAGYAALFEVEVSYGGVPGHADEIRWPQSPGDPAAPRAGGGPAAR